MTRYFAEAEAELNEAARFYEDRLKGLGASFLDVVEVAVRNIELHPRRNPVVCAPVRRRLLPKFPYAILYVIYHDEIIVVAIAHLSRHPTYWLGRLEESNR